MNADNHDGEKPVDKGFSRTFDKCPGCHSTERFFEGILNEMKERGLLDLEVNCFDFQLQGGFPLPQQKIATLPFGSEIPRFEKVVDTCCECGLEYAVKLVKIYVKKSIDLAPPPILIERRDEDWSSCLRQIK